MEHLGLALHKSPVVFRECWLVWNDTVQFNNTIHYFSNSTIYFRILSNTFFNFADIVYELNDGYSALKANDFNRMGANIGKIVSDVFIKSPADIAWSWNNSNIYTPVSSQTPATVWSYLEKL